LTEDAFVEDDAEAGSVLITRWGELIVDDADKLVVECLRRMTLGPISLHNVVSAPAGTGERLTHDGLARLHRVLDRFSGSVVHSLRLPDGLRPLLSVAPVVAAPTFRPRAVPQTRAVRLSRFSVLRPREQEMVLESALAGFEVVLEEPSALTLASSLALPATVADLVARTGLPETAIADVVAFLAAAGVVLVGDEDGRFAEDDDPLLRHWTPHELLFHVRSRGRQRQEVPAARSEDALPPVTAPVPPGLTISLYRPSLEQLAEHDVPLTELLEADHRCPRFSDGVISVKQIGELLFRSARIRSIEPWPLARGNGVTSSQRPYFSIACMYELELYLTASRCSGLPRGIYHYDPRAHALTLIDDTTAHLATLLDMGMVAAGSNRPPAAMITVAARRERTSWVFGDAAYSVTLMHVGALQQTIYLCANAVGLSAHAVPVDADYTVDHLLGLSWPREIGVGECVLDTLE